MKDAQAGDDGALLEGLRIRLAEPGDYDFVRSQSTRLAGVADLAWHDEETIARFQDSYIQAVLDKQADPESAALFIAIGADGEKLGFAGVEKAADPISGEACGYLNLCCVIDEVEGMGVGRQLMSVAEDWVRDAGLRLFEVDVFAANQRGREFYKTQGFREETTRLVKEVLPQGS